MDSAIDPRIIAFAGPPPPDVDLTANTAASDRAAIISVLLLALIAIALRFTARNIQQTKIHWDDWFEWLTMDKALVGGTAGLAIAGGHYGAGKHIWAVDLSNLQQIYKILFGYTFLYSASCAVIKISILLFYSRIFLSTERLFPLSMKFGYFLSISYPIVVWVTMGNVCRPLNHFWTQFAGTEGTCIDINTFFLALGIINMINDFYILLIPIPHIFRLQMSLRKRIGIAGILMLGGFVCAASAVRIHFLTELSKTEDVTRAMGPVFIWSDLEPCIAIVSACLPHLAPLRHIVRDKISSTFGSQDAKGTGNGSKQWKSATSNSMGPLFTYGGSKYFGGSDKLRLGDHDDEVELTNRITGDSAVGHAASTNSSSGENVDKQGIHVHKSYTQQTEQR
ncbi:Pth11-like integral membrane [Fusarium tjaetaba]|uniref:Pth11-like integral membrane n=1 Tax=Fusarium tjaetaba TaxID=1567544 RepID=A0A8H5RL21_9HYPO|nr:Pth11-like integral membrane [Fusarium tjaetaba]KAF5635262.1 Pth11-like integral membrane [Fusarium tjaetaba]